MTTSTATYAQFNGLNMHYEAHITGRPIILPHPSFAALIRCSRPPGR